MKHLGLLLLSAAALPLAAQQTTGTIGSYELDPPAGVVEELPSIKITFGDLGSWGLDDPDCSGITLTSGSGTTYRVVKTDPVYDDFCKMYFGSGSEAETITAPGSYTLSIPEGAFKKFFSSDKYNGPIQAVYTIEAPAANSLDNYTLTPGQGDAVSSISAVRISFPDAAATGVSLPAQLNTITLTGDGSDYVCVDAKAVEANVYDLYFGQSSGSPLTIVRPGVYTLFIPKKSFTATGTQEQNNSEIKASFTLSNPDFDSMRSCTANPAQDSYVESFNKVTLTFPDATKGIDFNADLSGVKLLINGEPSPCIAGNLSMNRPFDNVTFSFSATQYGDAVTFTDEGEYTVSVPAGVFHESGTSYTNSAIDLTFHVGEKPANPFDTYECTPTEGTTVGEIYELHIKFPELAEQRIQWPYDISKLTLQRVGDDTVYKGNTTSLYKGCEVITGFSTPDEQYSNPLHFRTPGEYVVTVPAGVFANDADPSVKNNAFELHFTVDAAYNFTYTLTPDPKKVLASLPQIAIAPSDVLTSINLAANSNLSAQLSFGDKTIALTAANGEQGGVVFTPASTVEPGDWTLNIPAGMLAAENADGLKFTNAEPVEAMYSVKEPQTFTYTTSPEEGATLPMFTKYIVAVEGKPKKVSVNKEAGNPSLQGTGKSYTLTSATSSNEVAFAILGGARLEDGEYTVSIPAGYIVTTDSNGLEATLPEITGSFKIHHPESSDFAEGMLLYNEGWYGHDMASFTHISNAGPVSYNVFEDVNPDKSLGLTGTWASRFADKLYAVSKQSGTNLNGATGGLLTQMDGASLTFIDQITQTPQKAQAHAFCGVDSNKGYLSTSTGIYPVDLNSMTLGECIRAAQTVDLKHGEMLRYQGRIFAAVKDWDPLVIDPETDTFTELQTGSVFTSFVTADGSLFMAKNEEGREFVKVDPITLSFDYVTLSGGEYTGRMRVANVWPTWRPAPLAVDKTENVVYYATAFDSNTIARANLDTGEFTADFITLPEVDGVQHIMYGQGISTDPVSGEIVIQAVEKGFGTHYRENWIYRFDPATGKLIDDKTIKLSQNYWFPSMAVYGGWKAPELNFENVSVADGNITIDMLEHTTLAQGNPYEVEYTVTSSNPRVCGVHQNGLTGYELQKNGEGSAVITVKADFMGLVSTAEFTVGTSALSSLEAQPDTADVYTTTGILVMRNADKQALRQLPAGIYIRGGKKIIVR